MSQMEKNLPLKGKSLLAQRATWSSYQSLLYLDNRKQSI